MRTKNITSPIWRCLAVAVAFGAYSMVPAQSQDTSNTLATLNTVYVADASAPWFTSWFEQKVALKGALFRPKIEVARGGSVLEKVASDRMSVGLLSKSELEAVKPLADNIVSAASGFRVCAALAVRDGASTTQVGDLALLPPSTPIAATSGTAAILRSLLIAHGLDDRLTISEQTVSAMISGLTSGRLALAALPVEAGMTVEVADEAPDIRYLRVTDAATTAITGDKFTLGSFVESNVLGVSLASSINTVCDDIMIVASVSGQHAPERLGRNQYSVTGKASESDSLLERTRGSLNELWNLIVARFQGLGK